jgi:hypothetical protein
VSSLLVALVGSSSYYELLLCQLVWVKGVLAISSQSLELALAKGSVTNSLIDVLVSNRVYLICLMMGALSRHLVGG